MSTAARKQLDTQYYEALGEQIADDLEHKGLDALPPLKSDPNPAARLRALAYRKKMLNQLTDNEIAKTVNGLREQGMSWNRIGHLLDLTGEAARKRYQRS